MNIRIWKFGAFFLYLQRIAEVIKPFISYCKRGISYHPMIKFKELIALHITFAA